MSFRRAFTSRNFFNVLTSWSLILTSLHFQYVMMHLLEPFASSDLSNTLIATHPEVTQTVATLMQTARASLETIARLYYLRHGFTTYAPVMLQFLSALGFRYVADCRGSEMPPTRKVDVASSLLLALQGLSAQGSCAHLSNTVFRLMYDKLPIEMADLANSALGLSSPETPTSLTSSYVRASYPVNLVNLGGDVEEQRLNNLLQKLQSTEPNLAPE